MKTRHSHSAHLIAPQILLSLMTGAMFLLLAYPSQAQELPALSPAALPAQTGQTDAERPPIHPAPRTSVIFPSPKPFTLDAQAAQTAIDLLRLEGFLLIDDGGAGPPEILSVKEVYAWFVAIDRAMPPGHRRRYDIHVNGAPVDWRHSYVEWGGEMVNLQILFTYRNQYPPANLLFRSRE